MVNNEAIVSIISKISNKKGAPCKKTLQKIVFLIEAKNVDLGCDYGIHFYGPYSSDLDFAVRELCDEGILNIEYTLSEHKISVLDESSIAEFNDPIVNQVINDLKLDTDYKALSKNIEVESVSNADLMKVTVTTTDPQVSANIVNYLTQVFEDKITEIYNIKNTEVIDPGEVDLEPVNVSWIKNIVIFGMVTVIFAMGIIFLVYFLDTTIKSKQDAEKLLDIPVLAVIPLADDEGDKKNEKKNK